MNEANEAKKGSKLKIVGIAALIYIVLYVAMSALGYFLKQYGTAGEMVGFNANLPLQMLNLIILLYLLNKILYKPVLNFMEERNGRIQRQIEEAEADRKKAREFLSQTEQELNRIRKESSAMLQEARHSAQQERERLMQKADEERTAMMERTQREISQQVEQARADLQAEVANLAVQISRQVVSDSLQEEDLRRLSRESLERIEQSQSMN